MTRVEHDINPIALPIFLTQVPFGVVQPPKSETSAPAKKEGAPVGPMGYREAFHSFTAPAGAFFPPDIRVPVGVRGRLHEKRYLLYGHGH